jgi:LPS sulfotransferase NodH
VERPTRCYLICANPRSGSTLLARALSDTGVAGHPEEYFLCGAPEAFLGGWTFWEAGPLAQRYGISDRESFFELVFQLGSTANGVFGAKVMWTYVGSMLDKFRETPRYSGMEREVLFRSLFPDLHVVHLIRRNRLRQAVSWLRAAQDGVWVVSDAEPANPSGQPSYDYATIDGMMSLIAQGEQGWADLFRALRVEPYDVIYEELIDADGYETSVRGVLRYLDLDDRIPIPSARTAQQADRINDQWVERFLREQQSTTS